MISNFKQLRPDQEPATRSYEENGILCESSLLIGTCVFVGKQCRAAFVNNTAGDMRSAFIVVDAFDAAHALQIPICTGGFIDCKDLRNFIEANLNAIGIVPIPIYCIETGEIADPEPLYLNDIGLNELQSIAKSDMDYVRWIT